MNKDAYYFPHFSNARHDRKVKRLIKELGVEGYGIFFMTLEVLREQMDYKYPMDDIDLLADEFGTSEQKLRVVICNYKLFDIDEENNFFSPKFIEFMQPYLKMKEQRKLAGKASAKARKEKKLIEISTTVEQPLNECGTTEQQSKVKESKVKESKVKDIKHKHGEYKNVLLTDKEFEKLNNDFDNAKELIIFLDEYIEMKGYKAKNHNLSIRKWVTDAVKEAKQRSNKINNFNKNNGAKVEQHNFKQRDIEEDEFDKYYS